MSNSLQPHRLQPTRLFRPWNFPGKNTGLGCHFLLQGIFLTQELNPGLPHCRQMLYRLSHLGSPKYPLLTKIQQGQKLKKKKKSTLGGAYYPQVCMPRLLLSPLLPAQPRISSHFQEKQLFLSEVWATSSLPQVPAPCSSSAHPLRLPPVSG